MFTNNGARRMTTTKAWDNQNRLTQISSVPSVASVVSFSYGYNAANQRIRRTDADGSYWRYEYDALGQVKSGKKYWPDGTPVAGQQFEYAHDDIGNRTSTKAGGDAGGAGLRVAGYSPNSLNQYTARDVPGAVDVTGLSFATNTVTVNGETAYRKGEYFRAEVLVSNGSAPVWQPITVHATAQSDVTGNVFLPKTQEQFSYDLDGNMTSDGRWTYAWDAENRLVRMVANTAVGPQQRMDFEYDWQGRRTAKRVWNNTGGAGDPAVSLRFVYDGWDLLGELNTLNSQVRTYTWGLDLSGTMDGAGGVGGLLEVTYYGAQTTNCLAAYDGNGNVAALINTADGKVLAQYDYGPFGEVIRATGPMAKANPFRFSTKYQDDESDFVYYGYRSYNPSTGRWLSRDQIEGDAGGNLYTAVRNNFVTSLDALGQKTLTIAFGFDSSAKATRPVMRTIVNGLIFLRKMVQECICQSDCGTSTEWVRVASNYDYNRANKPGPRLGIYDLPADRPLMLSNIKNINATGIPTLITRDHIREEWPPLSHHIIWAAAVTEKGVGTLYDVTAARDAVIAHELGHFAGYVGDAADREHSSDPRNLMNISVDKTAHPDCQWCQRVLNLAR